jgi:dihydropteroate synthase type 2
VIDVGAAASGPKAKPIDAEEELRRLSPVLEAFRERTELLSVDSSNPAVQLHALAFGVAYLNDVTGFPDASIYPDLARARCKLVIMHTMTGAFAARRKTAPGEAMASAERFFDSRVAALTDAGVARSRLVLDPGMGLFLGDDATPSLEVLRGVGKLRRRYGLPLMISVSRKSFLRELTGRALAERGPATLAAEIYAVTRQGAEYVRTHDPGALLDALRVLERLETEG